MLRFTHPFWLPSPTTLRRLRCLLIVTASTWQAVAQVGNRPSRRVAAFEPGHLWMLKALTTRAECVEECLVAVIIIIKIKIPQVGTDPSCNQFLGLDQEKTMHKSAE